MDLVELHNPKTLEHIEAKMSKAIEPFWNHIKIHHRLSDCHIISNISKCETDWFVYCVQQFRVTKGSINVINWLLFWLLLPITIVSAVVLLLGCHFIRFLLFSTRRAYFEHCQRSEWITRWNFHTSNEFSWYSIYANHLRDYNRIKLNIRMNFPYYIKWHTLFNLLRSNQVFFLTFFLHYRKKNNDFDPRILPLISNYILM